MAWSEKTGKGTWRVRYRRKEGGIGSVNGFTSRKAADDYATSMETDQQRGVFIDPDRGKTLVGDWVATWLVGLDVAEGTEDLYRSLLRNHIQPYWGEIALADISSSAVNAWSKELGTRYSEATVSAAVKLFRRVLADAVDERLIAINPVRIRRRGRQAQRRRAPEQVWVTPSEALAIADAAARLPHAGLGGPILIVTAAWTGARWGELVGLHRSNVHLHTDHTDSTGARGSGTEGKAGISRIVVDEQTGALHQSSSGLWIGPPKTPDSAREIELPPFLARLLAAYLDQHPHDYVFLGRTGQWHRRDNFARRVFRPAARGNNGHNRNKIVLPPIKPGLTFHGFRHSHKTWMIEDLIPEVASEARLGHVLRNPVVRTYSHVPDELRHMIRAKLQDRWDKAVAERGTTPDWRTAADHGHP